MAKGKQRRKPGGKSTKNMRRDREIIDTSKRELEADSRTRRDCFKSDSNDPAWYAHNPQLLRDYASYPFGVPVGTRIQRETGLSNFDNSTVPGLMVYYFSPAVGIATDANSPINIASRNIYSFVRHANSGHTNYDAPDLMLYLVAMDSLYMFHSYLRRLLGLVLDYTPVNRYYPDLLIRAMGCETEDISMHVQDLRGYINVFATKVGSMCVPNSMSYMARHTWMCEGIYTDSSASKAQTYMYSPLSFYKFSYDSNGAGQCELVPLFTYDKLTNYGPSLTFQDLVSFGNILMNAVITNEDMNIMSGDILKAFGNEGVVKMMGVSEGYMVLPTYNQEVLSQMENATVYNGQFATYLTQNKDVGGGYLTNVTTGATINPWLYTLPIGNGSAITAIDVLAMQALYGVYGGRKLLNFHHDGVSPEEVMVATRLTGIVDIPATITEGSASSGQLAGSVLSPNNKILSLPGPTNFGSEIINYAFALRNNFQKINGVWTYNNIRWINLATASMRLSSNDSMMDVGDTITALGDISTLSNFDWHHQVSMLFMYSETPTMSCAGYSPQPIVDIDNYTMIDAANMFNMTQAALLSEFSVPQMGAFSTKTV